MTTRPWMRTTSALPVAGIGVLVLLEGLVAARIGFPAFAFHSAVLFLASGLIVAGSGLAAWRMAPGSYTGPLLVLAGASSFIASFAQLDWDLMSSICAQLTWLHVAIVGQVVLTQPDGRVRGRWMAAIVLLVYLLAVMSPADDPIPLAIGLAVAMALRMRLEGRDHRRGFADLAGALLVIGLCLGPVLHAVVPWLPLNTQAATYASVAAAAVVLSADAIRFAPARARVTDAVLRLAPGAPVSIAAELRLATGDPLLEVGFPIHGDRGYVDSFGRPIEIPAPTSKRTVTTIDDGNRTLAIVVHDRRLDNDSGLQAAVARAAELATANARLQADLREQVADVRASRRRIVEAESDARQALERRLETSLLPGLSAIDRELTEIGDPPDADEAVIGQARATVLEIREQLQRVADGLHPAVLDSDGLAAALGILASRSHVPVTIHLGELPRTTPTAAETCWFVCSEALANVAKHAAASHVEVSVNEDAGTLVMHIADDGVGGADPARGSGLRGLIDRAEAVGGRLVVESHPSAGTRLTLELPVELP
jgi:signal transduction histidine kinase